MKINENLKSLKIAALICINLQLLILYCYEPASRLEP